jgi:hypothetical protein
VLPKKKQFRNKKHWAALLEQKASGKRNSSETLRKRRRE